MNRNEMKWNQIIMCEELCVNENSQLPVQLPTVVAISYNSSLFTLPIS